MVEPRVDTEHTDEGARRAQDSFTLIYANTEDGEPTLLIDEGDTSLPGNAELRGILNAGYTPEMAYVLRVVSERGGSKLARFSCWGPKAIARIGRLPDTLRTRCIILPMQKKMEHEQCERFVEDAADLAKLRSQCLRLVQDHAEAINTMRLELPKSLSDRATQIWEPLVILADLAGGDWPELARQAAVALSAKAAEHNPISSLLFAIWLSFRTVGGGRIFSRMLVQGLNSMDDKPWGTMANGKGITVGWLATQLERHGIKPRTIRIGNMQAKGYWEEDFEGAFQRYMSPSDREAMGRLLGLVSPIDSGAAAANSPGPGATNAPGPSDGPAGDAPAKNEEPGNAEGGEAAAA